MDISHKAWVMITRVCIILVCFGMIALGVYIKMLIISTSIKWGLE